jgi:hypothetical protein
MAVDSVMVTAIDLDLDIPDVVVDEEVKNRDNCRASKGFLMAWKKHHLQVGPAVDIDIRLTNAMVLVLAKPTTAMRNKDLARTLKGRWRLIQGKWQACKRLAQ